MQNNPGGKMGRLGRLINADAGKMGRLGWLWMILCTEWVSSGKIALGRRNCTKAYRGAMMKPLGAVTG